MTKLLATVAAIWAVLGIAVGRGHSAAKEARPIPLVICDRFRGIYCGPAIRVAWCESRWHTDARNGQYLGIFQMGRWERSRYGQGADAAAQVRAAWRYFVATGKTWGPWACRWAAS